MGVRVSRIGLMATTALSGSVRVSRAAITAALNFNGPVRVSSSLLKVANALNGPTRVSGLYLVSAQSYTRGLEFNTLDSSAQIFGIESFDIVSTVGPIPEHNPYRPAIPESVIDTVGPEFYDYAKENQEILREQHDLTQAGDTTFPYQMFISAHDEPKFRLGAISRFYHADYGVIHARYVQFAKMAAVPNAMCPVGLLKKNTGLKWYVTNQLDKSDASLVVGILAPTTLPKENQYGWVIVDGPNLQVVANSGDSTTLGESFAWSQTGAVSADAEGRIIGRRVSGTVVNLQPGCFHVELESFSKQTIETQVDTYIADIRATLTTMAAQLAGLQSLVDAQYLAGMAKDIVRLQTQINMMSGSLHGSIASVNLRIDQLDTITLDELTRQLANLRTAIEAEIDRLSAKVTQVDSVAVEALRLAKRINISNIEGQISSILDSFNTLDTRVKGKFPVVDGSVPPNLMYLDDGTLVYTETF